MRHAACRGLNPKLFFPERGEMVSQEARDVCASCPVQEECLEYAIRVGERDGVWGGKSGRQRRDMRSAEVERTRQQFCIQCGGLFLGNYRSKICSEGCRVKRQNAARAKARRNKNAAEGDA